MLGPAAHQRFWSCAFCGDALTHWPANAPITSCTRCRRPMVVLRPLMPRSGGRRVFGLLQCGYALYGIATIALVAAFIFLPMPPRTFARQFAVLLFIIGSVLITDGVLGIRARIDRIADQVRTGRAAVAIAAFRVGAGILAMLLCAYGLLAI